MVLYRQKMELLYFVGDKRFHCTQISLSLYATHIHMLLFIQSYCIILQYACFYTHLKCIC